MALGVPSIGEPYKDVDIKFGADSNGVFLLVHVRTTAQYDVFFGDAHSVVICPTPAHRRSH
jgi:hypothetical protein